VSDRIVNFMDAKPGDLAHTYTPDPTGECGWVTDVEWFDDVDVESRVKRQTWRLVSEERATFYPSTELCPSCHGEGETIITRTCETCGGSGVHPLAGQMVAMEVQP